MTFSRRQVALGLGTAALAPRAYAQSTLPRVDLALVLAVDSSASVSTGRWNLQLAGYRSAFRSPEVLEAISKKRHGIAVMFVEWSGSGEQRRCIGWHHICTKDDATAFADKIPRAVRRFKSYTHITAALEYSAQMLAEAPFRAERLVIDISGDGEDNTLGQYVDSRHLVEASRAKVVEKGITINGLPIHFDANNVTNKDIGTYYTKHVIGGTGAFCVPVYDGESVEEFARAVRFKLANEIA